MLARNLFCAVTKGNLIRRGEKEKYCVVGKFSLVIV